MTATRAGHILIVNDSRFSQQFVRIVLESEGYWVTQAQDGLVGLGMLRSILHPVIVMIDYAMWGMSGMEFLQAVDGDAQLARMHAYIYMPTRPTSSYQHELVGLRLVRPALLPKPFRVVQLHAAVAHCQATLGES